MRKKLFTLMTLLLTVVTGAWAQADPELFYKSDFTDNTAIWTTSTYIDDAAKTTSDYWMIKGTSLTSTKDLKGKKLIDPATNEVASSAQFSSSTTFYVEKDDASKKALRIHVTGVEKMYFYAWCNSTPDGRKMNISVNGSIVGTIDFAKSTANAQYTSVILNSAINNTILIEGTNEVELVAIKPITATPTVAFNGVKEGDDVLVESTDYSVSGTTITLTSEHKVAFEPTNIKLLQKKTFSDSSVDNEEIAVSFSENGDFFEGTVTINSIDYLVKVPVDKTPSLTVDKSTDNIILKSYESISPVTVKISGSNLTDGTYSAPSASGITVTPATFTVSGGTLTDEEFTITPSISAAASTILTFTVGTATVDYTLNFTQPAQGTATEVEAISELITWDWTKAGNEVSEIKLTDATTPSKTTDFILSNLPEINNDATFKADALKVTVEYPVREGKYMQGGSVVFKTTVPGKIKVTFSNTGSKDSNGDRCLTVDGTAYSDVTSGVSNSNKTVSKEVSIDAGEHTLSGMKTSDSSGQYLRFYKIEFTPTVSITPTKAMTTFSSAKALDFTGSELKAYVVSAITSDAVTLKEVNDVPAENGLVLVGTAGTTYDIAVGSTTTWSETNYLKAAVTATPLAADYAYVLSNSKFVRSAAGTLPAGKAYLLKSDIDAAAGGAPEMGIVFDDNNDVVTGIENVDAQKGILDGEFYNLSGQRVAQPTKGLYIVNGKKVIVK